MDCTNYNDSVNYNAAINYNGICVASNCTGYNDPIGYNAAINYNGICVSPTPAVETVIMGGKWNYRKPKRISDDDFAIVLAALELDD